MAYIGKEPQVGNYSVLDALSASSTASYTMQLSSTNFTPESANHLIVSLNGVIQKPGSSYTVSGSTITFSSSLTSSDSIDFIIALGNVLDVGTPSDATVTNAKLASDVISGETDIGGAIADADLILLDDGAGGSLRKSAMSRIKTYVGGGITEVDQWHLTSAKTDNSDITANLARVTQSGFGRLGTGMSESSGIFTFPSTGIWRVEFCGAWQVAAGDNASVSTYLTLNNSSYAEIAHTGVSNKAASGTAAGVDNGYVASLIDVTDVSNVKVKFTTVSMATDTQLNGGDDPLQTNIIFTRLGDT